MEGTLVPVSQQKRLWTGRNTGFLMVLVGATMWGLSGTAAQRLFQSEGFSPDWLVTMRMGLSGLLLLVMVMLRTGLRRTVAVWGHRRDRIRIIVFAAFGLAGVQYTYFAAIHAGNAATATFLQYLGPAFIILYLSLRFRRMPTRWENLSLGLALVGTFLLVTNGSIQQVAVPIGAFTWGILSAVALAFYTVYPKQLIDTWGSATVVGWAMLLGGIGFSLYAHPWHTAGQHWSWYSSILLVFVILFGTLLAFYLYLASMKYITPSESSLTACVEPLSAAVAAVVWLHTRLGVATVIGGVCIIGTVVVLTVQPRKSMD